MAKLKSYSCTKCAGVLNFDEDHELFACPFCGNEFNVVELHREELSAQGASALRRLRFDTAEGIFKTVLSKNPRDFGGHLGMILAKGRIASVENLSDIGRIKDCEFKPARRALHNAKKEADAGSAYFDKLSELLALAEKYKELCAGEDERTKMARRSFQAIADHELEVDIAREESKDNLSGIVKEYPAAALPVAIYSAVRFVSDEIDKKSYEAKHKRNMASDHIQAAKMSSEAEEIKKKYSETYTELKVLDPAVNRYKPAYASKVDAGPDPFADVTKNVNCVKCGGQLLLDKEKRLYACSFCGVAYGTSLFFDQPLRKAKQALAAADYTEADQRFSHMLMVDPKDYEALFGRILCAGKWKNVPDIELEDKMLPLMEERLTDRSDEAFLHSDEEHKEFFSNVQTIVTYYIKWIHLNQDLDSMRKAKKRVRSNSRIALSAYSDKEAEAKAFEIDKKIEDVKMKMKELRARFDELKRTIDKEKTAFSLAEKPDP